MIATFQPQDPFHSWQQGSEWMQKGKFIVETPKNIMDSVQSDFLLFSNTITLRTQISGTQPFLQVLGVMLYF